MIIFIIFSVTYCGVDLIAGEKTKSVWIKQPHDDHPRDASCRWNIKSQWANETIWVQFQEIDYVEVTSDSAVCLLLVINLLSFFFFSSSGVVKNR